MYIIYIILKVHLRWIRGHLSSQEDGAQPGGTLEQGKALLGVGKLLKVAFGLLGHPKCSMSIAGCHIQLPAFSQDHWEGTPSM